MATPRSNSACTLGSQEVGKLSLPSFSSCWPNALQVSAAVIAATNTRCLGCMGPPGVERAISHGAINGVVQNANLEKVRCLPRGIERCRLEQEFGTSRSDSSTMRLPQFALRQKRALAG